MGFLDFLKKLFTSKGARPPAGPRRTQVSAPAPQMNWPAAPSQPVQRGGSRPLPRQPERRETKLDLDAAQFEPLPPDQVREQAMATQFTGFFQFGRRDRIPSSADPRTKLIDQAMAGQGLITPEALVRIH